MLDLMRWKEEIKTSENYICRNPLKVPECIPMFVVCITSCLNINSMLHYYCGLCTNSKNDDNYSTKIIILYVQRFAGRLRDCSRVESYSSKHNWPQHCTFL